MSDFNQQLEKMGSQDGFIAALDQSGGSTPKALGLYGVTPDAWTNDEEMFTVVHEMRSRIMTSKSFQGNRILGAILFENTMDREVAGKPTSQYLWQEKQVVPFLKVDKGLADLNNGVQLMKPMPELDSLLKKAKSKGIFGTKMRSVIKEYNEDGIQEVVKQQFEVGKQILDAGLIPIIEPEVDIHAADKAKIETFMKSCIMEHLNTLGDRKVMLKLTIPTEDNLYADCIAHKNALRVVALSGGYSRDESNERLARQKGMIASFSRALAEGLNAKQSDDEFDKTLDQTIEAIFQASRT